MLATAERAAEVEVAMLKLPIMGTRSVIIRSVASPPVSIASSAISTLSGEFLTNIS